jgi:hypothetical protein
LISYRLLEASKLARVAEIDRTERVDTLYVQRGTGLEPAIRPRRG